MCNISNTNKTIIQSVDFSVRLPVLTGSGDLRIVGYEVVFWLVFSTVAVVDKIGERLGFQY